MNYTHLVYNLIKKDYILKYRNTLLGFIWSIAEPISTTIILYTIFSIFVKFQIKYYFLFLFNGLILWQFFSTTLIQGTNIFIENSAIIKKIFFPYYILYIPSILINFIQYSISLIILIILSYFISKIYISLQIIIIIFIIIILFLFFLTGMIMITSILNTKYRDISYLITIILKFWFYLTPIIYPLNVIPNKYKLIFLFNPIFPYVIALQNIIFFNSLQNIYRILSLELIYAVLFLLIGWLIYKKNYRNIPEEV